MDLKVGDRVKVNDRYKGGASSSVVYLIISIQGSLYDIAVYDGACTYPCYDYEIELYEDSDEYYWKPARYQNSSDETEKTCTCESWNLLQFGCKCGAFQTKFEDTEDQKIIDFFFPRSKK